MVQLTIVVADGADDEDASAIAGSSNRRRFHVVVRAVVAYPRQMNVFQ